MGYNEFNIAHMKCWYITKQVSTIVQEMSTSNHVKDYVNEITQRRVLQVFDKAHNLFAAFY